MRRTTFIKNINLIRMNMKVKYYLNLVIIALFMAAFTSCEGLLDEGILDEDGSGDKGSEISGVISESVTWERGEVYVIDGTVRVGATQKVVITIEPGAIIKFNEGAVLDLAYSDDTYASIIALGTEDKPIVFEANGSDNWGHISFFDGAVDCEFEYCKFKDGGSNDYYGCLYIEKTEVAFTNCSFSNSVSSGFILRTEGEFSSFSNNSFSEIASYPISIYPEAIHTIGKNNEYEVGQLISVANQKFDKAGDYIWRNQGIDYKFEGSVRIGSENTAGVNITVEPGTVLSFSDGVDIDFAYSANTYVTFVAIGTDEDPIVFTSASPNKEAGDWESLNFYDGAIDCEFDFCEFVYGGGYDYRGMIYIEETMVTITNSTIAHSSSYGIIARNDGEFFNFQRNTFTENALYPISIYPNAVYTMGPENVFDAGASILVSNDKDLTMSGEFTWLNQTVPYVIEGNMRLGSVKGTTLNINSGTVLKFAIDAQIQIAYQAANYGKIISKGTASEPVIFTSNSPKPANGDWKGITLYNGSEGTKLDNCIIDYAGGYYGAVALKDAGMNVSTIANTTISNSSTFGISVDNISSIDYSTVTFSLNEDIDYKQF